MSGWRPALRIARREARRAKGRAALVLALIALPVTALAFTAAGYDTFTLNPGEQADRMMGTGQALVSWPATTPVQQRPDRLTPYTTGTPGPAPQPSTERLLALLPPGSRVLPQTTGEEAVRTTAGAGTLATLALDYTDPLAQGVLHQLSGRAPANAGEVALTPAAAARTGAAIGDTVTSADGRDTLRVVGTVEQPGDLAAATIVRRPTGLPGTLTWLAATPAPMGWDAVKGLNAHGITAVSRQVLAAPPSPAERYPDVLENDDGPPAGTFALIAGLAMLEIVLLAGPAFAVGARRRRRDLGLVSAAGGTPAQLRRIVLADGVVLGGLAASTGVVLGIVLAAVLRSPLETYLGHRSGAFRIYPVAQAIVVGLAVLTGVLAALVPAWIAARQDVVAALRGRRGITRSRRRWLVLGVALTAAGAAGTVAGAEGNDLVIVLAGVIAVELGLVLCTPVLVGLVARLARWLPPAMRIALRDTARNRTAAAPAISAVMAVVIGSLAVSVILSAESASGGGNSLSEPGDVSLYASGEGPAAQAIPPDVISALRGTMPVQEVHEVRLPTCLGGQCLVTVQTPAAHACPYFHPGNRPPQPSADEQRAARADPRCTDVGGKYSYFGGSAVGLRGSRSFTSNDAVVFVVDDTAVAAVAHLPAEDGNRAAAALRAGAIVVSDARYVDAGRVTLAVAPQNGPVDHTVTAPAFTLPHRPRAPVALLTAATATALGLGTIPFTVAATTSRLPTADEQDRLQAVLGQEFEVRVDRGTQQDGQPLMILAIVAGVVTLAAAALATGLAAADGRADLATLAALGASPRLRRALSLSQAGVIAGLGSLLGTLAGLGTAIAVLLTLDQATADVWPVQPPLPIIVPWLNIGAALVVVPLIAMLGAGLLSRSRLPIEHRL